MKIKSNDMGTCPICGGRDLDYEALEVEDNCVYYPYTCKECKTKGKEWYRLDFMGHSVEDENGDMNIIENNTKEERVEKETNFEYEMIIVCNENLTNKELFDFMGQFGLEYTKKEFLYKKALAYVIEKNGNKYTVGKFFKFEFELEMKYNKRIEFIGEMEKTIAKNKDIIKHIIIRKN